MTLSMMTPGGGGASGLGRARPADPAGAPRAGRAVGTARRTSMDGARARPVPCAVEASNAETRTLVLRLSVPQVVAPGQYGVLYGPDGHVVAGGTIS